MEYRNRVFYLVRLPAVEGVTEIQVRNCGGLLQAQNQAMTWMNHLHERGDKRATVAVCEFISIAKLGSAV